MATKFIDNGEDKRLQEISPMFGVAFIPQMFITGILIESLIWKLVFWSVEFFISYIIFQHSTRTVIYWIKWNWTDSYLTPNYEDDSYIYDEMEIPAFREAKEKSDRLTGRSQ